MIWTDTEEFFKLPTPDEDDESSGSSSQILSCHVSTIHALPQLFLGLLLSHVYVTAAAVAGWLLSRVDRVSVLLPPGYRE